MDSKKYCLHLTVLKTGIHHLIGLKTSIAGHCFAQYSLERSLYTIFLYLPQESPKLRRTRTAPGRHETK